MEEQDLTPQQEPSSQEENVPKFRGLYRYVKISVKTLDIIIVSCIAVIIITVAVNLLNPGYTVTFNSLGGTDVAAVKCQYGELLTDVEPPTREGYTFGGWFRDAGCINPWNLETDTVSESLTLYALWIPENPQ
jgi:uncharacterized repeat protein (TIGR02543 family)